MSKKTYPSEFKQSAVSLVTEQGYSQTEAAARLGIPLYTLRDWLRKARESGNLPGPEKQAEAEELRRLRKENMRLQLEVEILKKAAAYFAKESL